MPLLVPEARRKAQAMTGTEALHHVNGFRRKRRLRRPLRSPRAVFGSKHEDAYNMLGEAINLAQALAALWRGIPSMKDVAEREAAIDGAKRIMSAVALNFEDAESQVDRVRQANAKLKPVAGTAANGSGRAHPVYQTLRLSSQ